MPEFPWRKSRRNDDAARIDRRESQSPVVHPDPIFPSPLPRGYNPGMNDPRTRVGDCIDDIGLGAVTSLFGFFAAGPAVSEILRSREFVLGFVVLAVGGFVLVQAGIRFIARGLVRLFCR
jgi:hypothetical protein